MTSDIQQLVECGIIGDLWNRIDATFVYLYHTEISILRKKQNQTAFLATSEFFRNSFAIFAYEAKKVYLCFAALKHPMIQWWKGLSLKPQGHLLFASLQRVPEASHVKVKDRQRNGKDSNNAVQVIESFWIILACWHASWSCLGKVHASFKPVASSCGVCQALSLQRSKQVTFLPFTLSFSHWSSFALPLSSFSAFPMSKAAFFFVACTCKPHPPNHETV